MVDLICESCGHPGTHPDCEEQAVWRRFGFEAVEGLRAMEWQRQVFALLAEDNRPDSAHRVLENDVAVFVGHGFIGSCGCLLRKADRVAFRFGSFCPAHIHLWGFMKGIDIVGRSHSERSNTLVLSELSDTAQARESLKRLRFGRAARDELIPALERGESVEVKGLDLYFSLEVLYEAERSRAFRFEVRPG